MPPEASTYSDICTYTAANSAFYPQRVLLRHLFFLNASKTKYVSVGFYPARDYCSVTRLGEDWLATSWPTAWAKVLRLCFPMNNDTDLFEADVTLVVIVKCS